MGRIAGCVVPSEYIPAEHSIVRCVTWSKLRKDADDNVVGIFAAAFKMRDDENELSANWLDHFEGDRPTKLTALLAVLRKSKYKPSPKSGLAIGIAGEISEAAKRCNASIRIIHAPEDDNSGRATMTIYSTSSQMRSGLTSSW